MPFDIDMIRTGGVEQDRGTPCVLREVLKLSLLLPALNG